MELYQKADLSLFGRSSKQDRLFEVSKDVVFEDNTLAFNAQRSAQETHSNVSAIVSNEGPATNGLRDDGGIAQTFGSLDGEKIMVSGSERAQMHWAIFQCSLCPKGFHRMDGLQEHLRTRHDVRRFVRTVSDEDPATNGSRGDIRNIQLSGLLDREENGILTAPRSSVHGLPAFELPPPPREQSFEPRQMVTASRLEDTEDRLVPRRKTTRLHSEFRHSAQLAKGDSIFINHTISEDRSGDQESVICMRLAALRTPDARAPTVDMTELGVSLENLESFSKLSKNFLEEIILKAIAERRTYTLPFGKVLADLPRALVDQVPSAKRNQFFRNAFRRHCSLYHKLQSRGS